MIEMKNLIKRFKDNIVVNNINLTIAKGELIALVGESGCGKTTTLKMVNRLVEKTSGTILLNGRDTSSINQTELRRNMGYVFQSIGLFPHLTVKQNVGLIPRLSGWSQIKIHERIEQLLDLFCLPASEFGDRYPRQLSGGQKQRVGIARALATKPAVVLMDEPFGAIDPINRDHLQVEFKKIHNSEGLTTIMVTHDMTEALLMADRIAVMLDGEIVEVAAPKDLLSTSRHPYVVKMMSTPMRQFESMCRLTEKPKGL